MLKNKCCLYVIISIQFFSITICNLLIEFPSYINCLRKNLSLIDVKCKREMFRWKARFWGNNFLLNHQLLSFFSAIKQSVLAASKLCLLYFEPPNMYLQHWYKNVSHIYM